MLAGALSAVVRTGGGVAYGVARPVVRVGGDVGLAGLDAVLASRAARDAVDLVVDSGLVDRFVEHFLVDTRLERILDAAQEAGVPRRVAERMLADGVADELAARLLEGPELERIVARALERQGLERVADQIVDSPAAERVLTRVMAGPLLDQAIRRLLESEELWVLVDEIAHSPAVTDAIGSQGVGFADQVAGAVRERTTRADVRLERLARRLARRRPAPEGGS